MVEIDNIEVISLDIFTFDCDGCEQCIKRCPAGVLDMVDNGFCRYAIVSHMHRCSGCGKCLTVCKTQAMKLVVREYA